MKQSVFVFFIFFIAVSGKSQSIHFENLSWTQALAKAKKENKILFVDMFTTWCTYCRQMDQSVFSDTETGNYYNPHFINVRYDALKNDGIQIRKTYMLLGFPTFLYLDANGLVILKTAGFQDTKTFIRNGDSAVSFVRQRLN